MYKQIVANSELITDEYYWLVSKMPTHTSFPSRVHSDGEFIEGSEVRYFDGRMWCHNKNSQALEKFDIYGPIPRPSFSNEKKDTMIADAFNRASVNGMIVTIKTDTLPDDAFSGNTNIKGAIVGVSVIGDRKEDIERQIAELGLAGEFSKASSNLIVELAIDIMSHNGNLHALEENNQNSCNGEEEMNIGKAFIFIEREIAIIKNDKDKSLEIYDTDKNGNINISSKGLLTCLDADLAKKVDTFFDIKCDEYGVAPISSIDSFSF